MPDSVKSVNEKSATPSPKPLTTSTRSLRPIPNPSPRKASPMKGTDKTLLLSIVLAFVAGLIGAALYIRFAPARLTNNSTENKQVILQEESATIDLVKKVGPAVVSITTTGTAQSIFGLQQQQQGAGTGIVVTTDGLILTNKHVVEGANKFTVTTTDGKQYDGTLVTTDPSNDIAFLRIQASGLTAAEIGDSDQVQVGQKVVAIGNALGEFANTVTTGVISGKSRPIEASNGQGGSEQLNNLFQTDAAINPGNSGGPLVNIEGQVIGVNTAMAGSGAQNIGFAIPINEVKNDIASVKDKGTIVRPYLGVRYVMITEAFAKRNNLPMSEGALLRGDTETLAVVPNSPAAKAGLREGDIITKLGGKDINTQNTLQSVLASQKVGDTVTVEFYRDGKTQSVQVTLEAAPTTSNQ